MEEFIFEFIDQCRILFYPEQWNGTFLDYSKNEVFALLYVYRENSANMTEISDYLGIPLNTTTGVIGRLEKRGVIKRERDVVDKRVVTITICEAGKELVTKQLKEMEHYYRLLMDNLTDEDKTILYRLIGKFFDIIKNDLITKNQSPEAKKTIRKIIIE